MRLDAGLPGPALSGSAESRLVLAAGAAVKQTIVTGPPACAGALGGACQAARSQDAMIAHAFRSSLTDASPRIQYPLP